MREIWAAMVFALALAGAHPAAAQAPKPDGVAPGATASTESLLAPTEQDRVLGKPDAPITIIEYASLSCSHCAHFANAVLPKLKENWLDTGKAKLILRDFPLDEPALRAGMVARCAPPERYYPLVDTLFEMQDKWVVARDSHAAASRRVWWKTLAHWRRVAAVRRDAPRHGGSRTAMQVALGRRRGKVT